MEKRIKRGGKERGKVKENVINNKGKQKKIQNKMRGGKGKGKVVVRREL